MMEDHKIRNMEEFSAASGISRPTVSKYFNDPTSVRPSTRERIEHAIAKYDYRPNLYAINQNRKATRSIGVIVPHALDPFFAEVVRQIEQSCFQAGYRAVVLSSHGDPERELGVLDLLYSMRIGGALIAPLGAASNVERLHKFSDDVPTVTFDSHLNGPQAFVGTDNFQSIGVIVDYLCRSGEPPFFVDLPTSNSNREERRDAYIRAMEAQALQPQVIHTPEDGWDFEEAGFRIGSQLIERRALPTMTALCANDRVAIGLIAAAYDKGLRIGRGPGFALRVAGHDDHPMARFTTPALTTVAQNFQGIADTSLAILFDMIEGGAGMPGRREQIEGKLVLRASA